MISLDVPFIIFPAGSGGGGAGTLSRWYAPSVGLPPVSSPVASGVASLAAGDQSQATGTGAVAFGYIALATANNTVAIGQQVNAQSTDCIAIGEIVTAVGAGAIAIGAGSLASGVGATTVGYFGSSALRCTAVGSFATANTNYGSAFGYLATDASGMGVAFRGSYTANQNEMAFFGFDAVPPTSANQFASSADNLMGALTTDATPTLMDSFGAQFTTVSAAAGWTPAVAMTLMVSASQTGGIAGTVGDTASWFVTLLLKRVGDVYTLVGSNIGAGAPTYNDAGAALWNVALGVAANGLTITVTGEVDKTIQWAAHMKRVETVN